MRLRTIATALTLALIAPLLASTSALAWHVETACEAIKYDGYAYQVYDGNDLIQDWTKGDTKVGPGTYKVKFTNGEKTTVEIEPCPPTEPLPVKAYAKGQLCGDPRAFTKVRNRGEVALKVRISYIPGNKDKPAKRKFEKRALDPGQATVFGQTWVRKTYKAQVKDPTTKTWETMFQYTVGKTLRPKPWGKGACPDDRFGTPGFGNPMVAGGYWATHTRYFTIAS